MNNKEIDYIKEELKHLKGDVDNSDIIEQFFYMPFTGHKVANAKEHLMSHINNIERILAASEPVEHDLGLAIHDVHKMKDDSNLVHGTIICNDIRRNFWITVYDKPRYVVDVGDRYNE